MEKIDENPTISMRRVLAWVVAVLPLPCVTHRTAKGSEMQHHRILILLFAAALVSATVLAFTTAAHAEDAIVKLVSAENGKCPQPINGSLNQGDANRFLP
jgi:FtsH-binding integral membrane protein